MKKSRFIKIFISSVILVLIFSISLFTFSNRLVKREYLDKMIENLTHLSLTIQAMIQPLVEQGNRDGLDLFVRDIYQQTGTRVTIILPDGRIFAETLKDFQEMENHQNRPEVKTALQGQQNHILRYSTTAKEEMLYIASPILIDGNTGAVLRLSVFLDEMNFVLRQLRSIFFLVTFIMILLSLGISYYISETLVIPVNKLLQGFERVGHGDLETRILYHHEEPEMKELIQGFNKMTDQIKSFVLDLSMQTEELNNIISTIQSGIVLLDGKGKIILSNYYFKKIFSLSKINEKYFWEAIRDERLNARISQLIEEKRDFSIEIELFKNDYLCSGIFINKKNKAVLVFDDISRSKKLAQIKRDLISNLSHELRTPLTSIKGYIETLEDQSETNDLERERYIHIIKRNTQRLINMVNDLLQLSELEDKDGKLEIATCNLKEIVDSLYKIFEPTVKEKNLKFNLNIAENIPEIRADSYKIEQMFINLIDNAIKYSEKGTINVIIQLLTNNKVRIEISDTGIGIQEEDLTRIFERFYVVNKARSRKQGGTGLGLSIVKHIVMLHQGEIEVKSQVGIGTSFIIILPVHQS